MIFAYILFWCLLVWGLRDGEIYAKEATIYAVLWVGLYAGILVFPHYLVWFVVPIIALPIVLILRVFGKDLVIR